MVVESSPKSVAAAEGLTPLPCGSVKGTYRQHRLATTFSRSPRTGYSTAAVECGF
jgi:hypothetical protein